MFAKHLLLINLKEMALELVFRFLQNSNILNDQLITGLLTEKCWPTKTICSCDVHIISTQYLVEYIYS